MRILLVAFVFPPYNVIGAVRIGKLAKFLCARGHDVRVLTADGHAFPPTLPSEIPDELVCRTGWLNVGVLLEYMARRVNARAAGGIPTAARLAEPSADAAAHPDRLPLKMRLAMWYRALLGLPDLQAGWYPYAVARGKQLLEQWQPELVYATALPVTGLFVGARLAHLAKCPLVTEFRDLWADNPYSDRPGWRLWLDKKWEAQLLRKAAAVVTISEPLADELRAKVTCPVHVIANGFDPADFSAAPSGYAPPDTLRIYYGGTIYPGRRDPAALFAALQCMGERRRQIEVVFSGQDLRGVMEAAAHYGVADCVTVESFKAYRESLAFLAGSDIALLLLWNDKREEGVLPVKLFEYLGARRPILMLGYENGVAARIVRERDAGLVANSPAAIAEWLEARLSEKVARGALAPLPETAGTGFCREDQFALLEAHLFGVVNTMPQAR